MLKKIIVPAYPEAQKLLSSFKIKASKRSELDRIKYAQELCLSWNEERIPFPPPAVPDRNDYWYLVQLYALDRHINRNHSFYHFDLGMAEEIYLDQPYTSSLPLLRLLYRSARKKRFIQKNTTIASRKDLDVMIDKCQEEIINHFKFNFAKYKFSLIPYDILLRLTPISKLTGINLNTYLDGYRLRSDGRITGLFGGNKIFGGNPFIDSLWLDCKNTSITAKLVIIRKDYGYKN